MPRRVSSLALRQPACPRSSSPGHVFAPSHHGVRARPRPSTPAAGRSRAPAPLPSAAPTPARRSAPATAPTPSASAQYPGHAGRSPGVHACDPSLQFAAHGRQRSTFGTGAKPHAEQSQPTCHITAPCRPASLPCRGRPPSSTRPERATVYGQSRTGGVGHYRSPPGAQTAAACAGPPARRSPRCGQRYPSGGQPPRPAGGAARHDHLTAGARPRRRRSAAPRAGDAGQRPPGEEALPRPGSDDQALVAHLRRAVRGLRRQRRGAERVECASVKRCTRSPRARRCSLRLNRQGTAD